MFRFLALITFSTTSLIASFYYNGDKKVQLIALNPPAIVKNENNNKKQDNEVKYYKTKSGLTLGVDKKIIINFENLNIQGYIEKEFSLHFIKALTKNMYLYSIKDSSKALKIANKINTIKGVKFAHPDFILKKRVRTNDPLYDASWHLNYWHLNMPKAWQYTKGEGVVVGVYDEGIDLGHEDLRANIIGFGNYANGLKRLTMFDSFNSLDEYYSHLNNYDENAPSSSSDRWHGTACSGIVAALGDNYEGSVGIAPKAKLIVARYSKNNISDDSQALIDMANNGAAIITNSWGTNNIIPSFNETLKLLSQEGRDGKGVLLFFAAGNDGCNMDKYFRTYGDEDNPKIECSNNPSDTPINDESESPYVISIAASTNNNHIAPYSNYGSAIDFVAPGGLDNDSIITTDAMGSNGFSYGDYTPQYNGFSGTSASAPMAAAVAALILSANPNLSKEEVIEILKYTAKKVGRYPYDSNGRNDHWGYGLINAGDAVELAVTYGKRIDSKNFASKIYQSLHN